MGKGYHGKTCAYCAQPGSSTTADHVFARQFFTATDRNNLPKVPACAKCNGKKSDLEHYLGSVLPFGGRHADASTMLSDYVPGRLAKNIKLHRKLAMGMQRGWKKQPTGILATRMGIPFDGGKLADLFAYVVKGLTVHHWNYVIPPDTTVRVSMINSRYTPHFEELLSLNGKRVRERCGNDVFIYEGVQSIQEPQISIWKFTPYGGVDMGGDPDAPDEAPTDVWVATNPSSIPSLMDI